MPHRPDLVAGPATGDGELVPRGTTIAPVRNRRLISGFAQLSGGGASAGSGPDLPGFVLRPGGGLAGTRTRSTATGLGACSSAAPVATSAPMPITPPRITLPAKATPPPPDT